MRIHTLLLILIGVLVCFAANQIFPFYKFFVHDHKASYYIKRSGNRDDAQKEILEFCREKPFQSPSYQELTDEEYMIYAVTVEEFFKSYIGTKPQIYRRAVNPICQEDSLEYMIKKAIPTKVKIKLVDNEFRYIWAAVDADGNYKDGRVSSDVFQEGVGRGVYRFSRVAFSKGHDKAYLKYHHMCGRLCGGINILVFVKDKEKWMFSEAIQEWVF